MDGFVASSSGVAEMLAVMSWCQTVLAREADAVPNWQHSSGNMLLASIFIGLYMSHLIKGQVLTGHFNIIITTIFYKLESSVTN